MNSLPFANRLRALLGLPLSAVIADAGAGCLRADPGVRWSEGVELSQSDPARMCAELGFAGPDRIHLLDSLLSHGEFRPAYNLAGFLASTPRDVSTQQSSVDHGLGILDLGRIGFMRMLAALAAIQGGMFRRAHAVLSHLEHWIGILPDGEVTSLLSANRHLLLARLAQVQGLPVKAGEEIQAARAGFASSGVVLRGLALLDARSQIDGDQALALRTLEDMSPEERAGGEDHVLGSLAEHFFYYLLGRLHLELEHWSDAEKNFDESRRHLIACSRCHARDPLREAFLQLGVARVKVGRGSMGPDVARDLAAGRRQLRESIALFRRHNFTPGEFLAFRFWLANAGLADSGDVVQQHKTAYDLARRSGVIRFRLDAGVEYAARLFKFGRPIAASAVLESIKHIRDAFAGELKEDPMADRRDSLLKGTSRAADNGVVPTELWGLSDYAHREKAFVEAMVDTSDAIVSVYGPSGSGRRILVDRIARARALRDGPASPAVLPPAVVDAFRRSPGEIEVELSELTAAGRSIVLYDLDVWAPAAQQRAHTVLQRLESEDVAARRRFYVTLRQRREDVINQNLLIPAMAALVLPHAACNIEPLTSRPEDTLLLARGFLVTALVAKNAVKNEQEAKLLIFTSGAARELRNRYTHIGALYRAMQSVAADLRWDLDLFDAKDANTPYKKVPWEVIDRLLPADTEIDAAPGRRASRARRDDTPEILSADAATVRALAIQFRGRLAALAAAHEVPRSTLIRAWETSGVLEVWYESGGRKTREPRSRTS